MKEKINTLYGNKIRIRICGICLHENRLLLINHEGVGEQGSLWAPPGGGLEFNESIEDCLKREFLEETGLTIEVEEFLFVNEFIDPPLHAIELFYKVTQKSGTLKKGTDPEMEDGYQIIKDINYFTVQELKGIPPELMHSKLKDTNTLHKIF